MYITIIYRTPTIKLHIIIFRIHDNLLFMFPKIENINNSLYKDFYNGQVAQWQLLSTVNALTSVFGGSSPSLPTILMELQQSWLMHWSEEPRKCVRFTRVPPLFLGCGVWKAAHLPCTEKEGSVTHAVHQFYRDVAQSAYGTCFGSKKNLGWNPSIPTITY